MMAAPRKVMNSGLACRDIQIVGLPKGSQQQANFKKRKGWTSKFGGIHVHQSLWRGFPIKIHGHLLALLIPIAGQSERPHQAKGIPSGSFPSLKSEPGMSWALPRLESQSLATQNSTRRPTEEDEVAAEEQIGGGGQNRFG